MFAETEQKAIKMKERGEAITSKYRLELYNAEGSRLDPYCFPFETLEDALEFAYTYDDKVDSFDICVLIDDTYYRTAAYERLRFGEGWKNTIVQDKTNWAYDSHREKVNNFMRDNPD